MKMKVAFWIWTVVIFIGVVLLSASAVRDRVYTGTDLTFRVSTDDQTLWIDTTSEITLQAASSDTFRLHKLGREVIVGTPTEPPLGCNIETYYVAGPTQILGGEWLVEGGNAILHLSDNNMAVTAVMTRGSKLTHIFLVLLGGIAVWAIGYQIEKLLLKIKEERN